MEEQGYFDIGKRNHVGMRQALWKAGLIVHGEATGGTSARSIRLEVGSGRLWVREGIQPAIELLAGTGHAQRRLGSVRSNPGSR
jgi:chemotaxis receptor (MCP) glutamine deamidase CheD